MSFPRYPKYKPSGVEWLGEVPEHWERKRLKHACYVFPSNVDKKTHEGETPVRLCNYTDVYYNDTITDGMEFMAATATSEQIAKFTLRAGDTIITKDSETSDDIAIGAYVPADLPGVVCGYHLSMVRPLGDTNGAFVKRLFESIYAKSRFAVLANGLTRVGLGQHALDNVELAFPSPAEQTQIASFLDRETAKIDELVVEQRRLMELLKEKRQAVISHAVTQGLNPKAPMKPSGIEWLGDVPEHWKVRSISSISTKVTNGFVGPTRDILVDEGVRYLQSLHIKRNRIIFKVPYFVSAGWSNNHSKSILEKGDVLIVQTGDIGQVAVVPEEFVGCNCHALIIVSPLHTVIAGEWLSWVLNSPYGNNSLLSIQTGALHPHLNCGNVKLLMVPLPPLNEQSAIVEHLESVIIQFDNLTAEAQRAIDLLQERRTALISAAVTGQIDVREQAAVTVAPEKPYSSGFARQLLAAEILHHCHQHPTTGRVKLQKLIHLCEHIAEIEEVGAHYARKAAGPFDNKVMFGIASGLSKQKWFSEKKDGIRTIYLPMEKAGEHTKYLTRWEDKLPAINKVLQLLGKADTQQCEIVSTLYAAWNDLLIEGRKPTDAEIIHEASDPVRWHENKAKIPAEKWPTALKWMKEKAIIPKGFGSHTSSTN